MCRSIISISKIAHKIWCDHPFSKRNKATKRAEGEGEWGFSDVNKAISFDRTLLRVKRVPLEQGGLSEGLRGQSPLRKFLRF